MTISDNQWQSVAISGNHLHEQPPVVVPRHDARREGVSKGRRRRRRRASRDPAEMDDAPPLSRRRGRAIRGVRPDPIRGGLEGVALGEHLHALHATRSTVEGALWKERCGKGAVEGELWKGRCGRGAVKGGVAWKRLALSEHRLCRERRAADGHLDKAGDLRSEARSEERGQPEAMPSEVISVDAVRTPWLRRRDLRNSVASGGDSEAVRGSLSGQSSSIIRHTGTMPSVALPPVAFPPDTAFDGVRPPAAPPPGVTAREAAWEAAWWPRSSSSLMSSCVLGGGGKADRGVSLTARKASASSNLHAATRACNRTFGRKLDGHLNNI